MIERAPKEIKSPHDVYVAVTEEFEKDSSIDIVEFRGEDLASCEGELKEIYAQLNEVCMSSSDGFSRPQEEGAVYEKAFHNVWELWRRREEVLNTIQQLETSQFIQLWVLSTSKRYSLSRGAFDSQDLRDEIKQSLIVNCREQDLSALIKHYEGLSMTDGEKRDFRGFVALRDQKSSGNFSSEAEKNSSENNGVAGVEQRQVAGARIKPPPKLADTDPSSSPQTTVHPQLTKMQEIWDEQERCFEEQGEYTKKLKNLGSKLAKK